MKCDVIAEGVIAAAKELSLKCRWSSASKARMSKKAKQLLAAPASRSLRPMTSPMRHKKSSPLPKELAKCLIWVNKEYEVSRSGNYGSRRFSRHGLPRLRHSSRGRRDARAAAVRRMKGFPFLTRSKRP